MGKKLGRTVLLEDLRDRMHPVPNEIYVAGKDSID
jgi:hypothetical protein